MKKIYPPCRLICALVFGAATIRGLPVTEFRQVSTPSAPLVIAAYAFVWLAFMVYVWMMWRKLGKVEQELTHLSAQIGKKRP